MINKWINKWQMALIFVAVFAPAMAVSQEFTPGKSYLAPGRSSGLTTYTLDAHASGTIEKINNIVNMTVVSRDANDLKAEYRAGFVQGRLQGKTILSARDNAWDNAYLFDPSHSFPKQHGPTGAELNRAADILNANYFAFLDYLAKPQTDTAVAVITSYSIHYTKLYEFNFT